MEKQVLSGLQPARVMYYFEQLCAIPHGSRNTKQISDWCVAFAKAHALRCIQDDANNVIIFKNGSKGYEAHEPVILQGHLDMVAEKTAQSTIDFMKDGLSLCTDGSNIWADGTTLGGDDGIAVAYALALLESAELAHPPLEVVFTVDEEIGMEGAEALDTSVLRGKTMINCDSEDEGILTVSCAGGATSGLHLSVSFEAAAGNTLCVCVDGLTGGHSGQEINRGRENANKLMGALLQATRQTASFRLLSVNGGQKDNAIPRSCTAELIASEPDSTLAALRENADKLLAALPQTERSAQITVKPGKPCNSAMTEESTKRVIGLLCSVPNGVQAMSKDIDGLVQTSLNIGILKTCENTVSMTFSVRSSVNGEKLALIERLRECGTQYGASYTESGQYPAWEFRKQSRLRSIMVETFEQLYGRTPVVEAIHAGLECGIFCDRIKGLDCVSIGPDMQDIHTTRERLNVDSVRRTWDYLLEILKKL